jgi:hypothetical protein
MISRRPACVYAKSGYKPDRSLTVQTDLIADSSIQTGHIVHSSDELTRPDTWLTDGSLTVVHAMDGDDERA